MRSFSSCSQVACMLGLLYLTSVASLIAVSAVLHQLSTSSISSSSSARIVHLPDSPFASRLPSPAGHPNCCVPDSDRQNQNQNQHQHRHPSVSSPFPILSSTRPASVLSPDSVLCFWDSLLSSLALTDPVLPPQPDAQAAFPSFLNGAGCTDQHFLHQCGTAQNASVAHCGRWNPSALLGPWFPPPALLSGAPLARNPHQSGSVSLTRQGCCPHTSLPFGKVPALLVPG